MPPTGAPRVTDKRVADLEFYDVIESLSEEPKAIYLDRKSRSRRGEDGLSGIVRKVSLVGFENKALRIDYYTGGHVFVSEDCMAVIRD